MTLLSELKRWAATLKKRVVAIYIAARDTRTPLAAKIVAFAVAAYALSPIDLIPDFIPVLGYLDDLLIVPIGLWLAVRMVPKEVLADAEAKAAAIAARPRSYVAAVLIVGVWIACALGAIYWLQAMRGEST